MPSIPIKILSDEKGYIDRECPKEECMYTFKILAKDWIEKVSDDKVYCPMCGHVDSSEKWMTQRQLSQIRKVAANWASFLIQSELDKVFKDFARSTGNSKNIRLTYKPGRRVTFVNNPIGQSEEWETEICCEKCGTHYSVIGTAYFCPCCGYNSAVNAFNASLDSINKMIDSLAEMNAAMRKKYDADSAETMCRSLVENSIGNLVSAFQKFASCRYEELSGKRSRVNDFQMVDKGSQLFEKVTGKKYSDWLSASELEFMKVMFQRRHLLEHNNGVVDQQYLDKSKDTSYAVGQRVIVKEPDAYTLLHIIRKLGNELLKLRNVGNLNVNI